IFPELILMDINLPDLSGLDVTTKIRSIPNFDRVKIIAITAEVGEGGREKALAAGCDGFIPKPIDSSFVKQLNEFLSGKYEKLEKDVEVKYLKQYSKELIDKLLIKYEELEKTNQELENTLKIIQEVNQKLILLNKMEENFVAISSHELRTPVVVVKGFIDLIADGAFGELNPKLFEIVKVLQININRLIKTIEDITNFANLKDGSSLTTLTEVDIVKFLESIFNEYAVKFAERKLSYHFESYVKNPMVYLEATLFTQAINNLISNAIKYTADLGSVTLGVVEEETQYKIYVRDTGIGIESQFLEKIFDKFFTIQDSSHYFSGEYEFMAGGKGLGLSIVKNIARIHQGNTWAESEGKNKGSTFYFTIPKDLKRKLEEKSTIVGSEKKIYVVAWKDALDYINYDIYDVEMMSIPDFILKCDILTPSSLIIIYIAEISEDIVYDIIGRIKTNEKLKMIPIIAIDKKLNNHIKVKLYTLGVEEYLVEPIDKAKFNSIFQIFAI
ncbi:MAG: ATP-binding protein, partial [Exilispira sp.]